MKFFFECFPEKYISGELLKEFLQFCKVYAFSVFICVFGKPFSFEVRSRGLPGGNRSADLETPPKMLGPLPWQVLKTAKTLLISFPGTHANARNPPFHTLLSTLFFDVLVFSSGKNVQRIQRMNIFGLFSKRNQVFFEQLWPGI